MEEPVAAMEAAEVMVNTTIINLEIKINIKTFDARDFLTCAIVL